MASAAPVDYGLPGAVQAPAWSLSVGSGDGRPETNDQRLHYNVPPLSVSVTILQLGGRAMTSISRLLDIILLLTGVGLSFGLNAAIPSPNGHVNIDRLVENILETYATVATVRYKGTGQIDTVITKDTKTGRSTLATEGRGAFDQPQESIYAATRMTSGGRRLAATDVYLVGAELFLYHAGLNRSPRWMRTTLASQAIQEMHSRAPLVQERVLFTVSELEYLGEDTVEGIPCIQFALTPARTRLWEWLATRPEVKRFIQLGADPEKAMQGFSTVQWYAKDSLVLMRSKVRTRMLLNQESTRGRMDAGTTLDITVASDTLFFDHNGPVDITVPDEAKDAEFVEPSSS